MTKHKVHFSTGKDNWQTPPELFNRYNDIYHFSVDAAADSTNHLCPRWWGPGGELEDSLKSIVPWIAELDQGHNIWLNPPYSRTLQPQFVSMAADAADQTTGTGQVICLLPARTDTRLFHNRIKPWARSIEFLKGRIRFVGAAAGAPFPSMIVVF
jgi:phage N-6-adenine-methyltransferase